MKNPIQKRKYYAIEIILKSPLSVSGGISEYTDSDVLRNGNGDYFIPGTSIAGALRNYLGQKKNQKSMMGFSDGNDGKMSSLYISDLYFTSEPVVSVRDGVELSEEKTVLNKFDMQIIETGAKGTIFIQCIEREQDVFPFDQEISCLIQAIQSGEIRFGANKNRGFGRLEVVSVSQIQFEAEEVDQWIAFQGHDHEADYYTQRETYKEWLAKQDKYDSKYVKIQVPLKLNGGISIRKYSTEPNKADYEHLTCNGKPVIPGSSWNGAIRSDARKILQELGCDTEKVNEILERCFGTAKRKKQAQIVVGESVIEGAVRLPMTRNQINRFDASTKDGALYSEIAYFGGKTSLEFLIKKEEDWMAMAGILKLIIRDIQEGYLAVGGETAIGRGIFEPDEERDVIYSEQIADDTCFSALYAAL